MRRAEMFGGGSPWMGQGLPTLGPPVATGGGDLSSRIRSLCTMGERYGGASGSEIIDFLAEAAANVLEGLPPESQESAVNQARSQCPKFDTLWPQISDTVPGFEPEPDEPEPEPEPPFEPEAESVPTGAGASVYRCFQCPDGTTAMMYAGVAAQRGCTPVDQDECAPSLPERPPTPTPSPMFRPEEEVKCYACGSLDFRMLTEAQAQAQGCTLTAPQNCEPKPEPTQTSSIPTPSPMETSYTGPAARATTDRMRTNRYSWNPPGTTPTAQEIEEAVASAPFRQPMPSIPGGIISPGVIAPATGLTPTMSPSAMLTGRPVRISNLGRSFFGASF